MGAHSRPPAPSRALATTTLTAAGMAGTVAAGVLVTAGAAQAATPAQQLSHDLSELRQCESSGDYAIDTGNGYYGAYQFDLGTWQGLGLSGLPSQAAPAVQDRAAAELEEQRGWEPWPACSARLGLTPIYGVNLTPTAASAPAVVSRHEKRSQVIKDGIIYDVNHVGAAATPRLLLKPHSHARARRVVAPHWAGHVFTTAMVDTWSPQVMRWQARMAARGWYISVDGYFGPQSAAVASMFTHNFRISGALPGEVTKTVWDAAWTRPVIH